VTAQLDERLGHFQSRSLTVGGVALIASIIGAFFNAQQFFISYLFSYLFWLGLAAGCILVAMIHYLTGGQWGHPVRRFMEAGFTTLPLLALLFIPILFGLKDLYPWAQSGDLAKIIQKKQPYLGVTFFIVRVVVILAIWIWFALRLRRWSLAQDLTQDATPTKKLSTLSGPGLVIIPITATVAYVDWIMSMEPKWYSTIFAIIVLAGQVLVAYAFAVILLKSFETTAPIAEIASRKHYHQLGNLLLTFVMFWTYVAFGQLLIIYSGNKPDEISWYLHRITGGWQYILGVIAFFHFFLPFLLLLFRGFKTRSSLLATLAVVIIAVHLLYSYWMISPSIFHDGVHLNWLNFVVPIALGGIWLSAFFWLLRRAPLVPLNDPRMRAELAEEGSE
jgi:hypothetical protein